MAKIKFTPDSEQLSNQPNDNDNVIVFTPDNKNSRTTQHIVGRETLKESDFEPGWFATESGQTFGGMAAAIPAATKAFTATPPVLPFVGPFAKPAAALLAGGTAAFLGGATGDLVQQGYQVYTDKPYAPKTMGEALQRAFDSGGEEFLYELGGQAFFRAGAKIYHAISPTAKASSDLNIARKEAREFDTKQAQKEIKKHGGKLTASQVMDSKLIETIEGLVEASWGGSSLRNIRELNAEAVEKYANDFLETFAGVAKKELTRDGIGQLFLGLIKTGKTQKRLITNDLYKALDELYKPLIKKVTIKETNPTGILDASGNMLNRKTVQIVEQEVLPVSTSAMKKIAKEFLDKTKPTAHSGLGSEAKSLLEGVAKFDKSMSFEAIQTYRSDLLATKRALESVGGEQKGGLKRVLSMLIKQADEAMELGAKNTNNQEFIEQWDVVKTFVRESSEDLSNKLINKLIHKNSEEIGDYIFRNGSVTDIKLVRKAIAKAAELSKEVAKKSNGKVKAFSFSDKWTQVQAGYLNKIISSATSSGKSIINKSGDDIVASELSPSQLKKLFIAGTKENDTFVTAFSSTQRKSIRGLVSAVEIAQKKPKGAGTFMVQVTQASILMGGGFISKTAAFLAIGGLTIGAGMVGKILTNPGLVKLLTAGLTTRAGSKAAADLTQRVAAHLTALGIPFYMEKYANQ